MSFQAIRWSNFSCEFVKRTAWLSFCVAATFMLSAGCTTTYELRMGKSVQPESTGVESSKLTSTNYTKVMVTPYSGARPGGYENLVALIQLELMRQDVTVVSATAKGEASPTAASSSDTGQPDGADLTIEILEFR